MELLGYLKSVQELVNTSYYKTFYCFLLEAELQQYKNRQIVDTIQVEVDPIKFVVRMAFLDKQDRINTVVEIPLTSKQFGCFIFYNNL